MILTKASISELKKVTVKIVCPKENEGSGIILSVKDILYVLTAAHVVENENKDGHWDEKSINVSMFRNNMPYNFSVEEIILYNNKTDAAVMRVTYSGTTPLKVLDRLRILTSEVNGVATFCGIHRGEQTPIQYNFENRGVDTWAIANVNLATQPLPPKANFEGTSGGGIFYQDDEKYLYLVAFMSSLERYDGTNNEFDCLPAHYFNEKHQFDFIIDERGYEYSQSDGEASSINGSRSLKELDRSGYDKNQKGFFIDNDTTNNILAQLRDDDEMTIVLSALSGMGKSKLIYEAFRWSDKQDRRYYAKYDDDHNQILKEAEQIMRKNYDKDGIIIVDDWPVKYISDLIEIRNNYNGQFRLIMVNHDFFNDQLRSDSFDYRLIKLKPEEMEEKMGQYISQELKENAQNEADVKAIKQMAGGYPQMAIELVKAYKAQNSVGPEAVSHLMPKLLSFTPAEEKEEKAIWQTLSLCMPFPYKDASHEGFSFLINDEHVTQLGSTTFEKRRSITARLVQKYSPTLIDSQGIWLYVRPFPLAVWLTSEWFKEVCNTPGNFKEFIESVKKQPEFVQNAISEGFCKHIQQMSGNKDAFKMVDKLVNADVNNPFFNEETLCSGLGSKLFLAMSTVNPAAIAANLRRVLGCKDIEWLKDHFDGDGRRNVVWALERLCFAHESYNDAVEMMARLAMAENEDIGNNATGQLIHLFHIALAGTEVNLKVRLQTLKDLIIEGKDYITLIVRCFDAALRNGGFSRMGGAEKFGFENKKDYTPNWSEVFEYWYGCRDLLLDWMEKKPEVAELLAGMVEENVYHWARGGQKNVLVPLMERIAIIKDFHWDSGYEALAKTVYTFGIDGNALGVIELMKKLKNESFKTKLNEARYILHGKYQIGNEEQMTLSESLFVPLADEFLEKGVFLDNKEVSALLEDNEYIPFEFVKRLATQSTDEQLGTLFNTIFDLINTKPSTYYSPFLGNLSSYSKERMPLNVFLDRLRDSGQEYLYVSLMASTENERLVHFYQMLNEQRNGALKEDFLAVYLRFFRTYSDDLYLLILKALKENYPDRPNDLIAYVETERFMMRKDDNPEAVAIVKEAMLNFVIDGDTGRMLNEYSRLLIETLQQWHDVDFAKQVSKKFIEAYNTQMVHLSTEGVFTELLKDYFDDVWPDFVKAFLGPDTFLFYYQVKDELGSGFGFGKGPLFEINEDLIKQLCFDYPESAPVRIASMVPCFDPNNNEQFSKWVIWLLDNFGEQKDVRSSISGNLGSFSWTGNVSPYYERNIKCFEKLLNHKLPEVRDWAQQRIKEENKLLEMEKVNEDFMSLRYGF